MNTRCCIPLLLAALCACSDPPKSNREASLMPGEEPSALAAEATPEPLEVPDDAPLVVFLGDSLAAGLHLAADQAFPAQVQRILVERERPFRLVNAGVSGDTSAGGLRRIDWLLRRSPDLVVLELGYNDGLRGKPAKELEANLRGIVEACHAAGARVLLLGARLPPNLGPEYTKRFAEVYPRLAEELELAFVPHFVEGVGGVPELNLEDGIHPTPEGHRILAERVAPALESALAEL